MHARILWAVIAGFLCGVFIRSFFLLSWPFAAWWALIACALTLYAFFDARKREAIIVLAIAMLSFGAGLVRMDIAGMRGEPALTTRLDKKVSLVGIVMQEPDVRESGVRLSLDAYALIAGSTTIPLRTGVLVQAPPHTAVSYGDVIRAAGKLELPETFDTGAGHTFNYPQYLAKDGILYGLSFAQVETTGENHGNLAKKFAIAVKQTLLSGLEASLPEPEAGLAAGITLGDKRSVGKELSEVFVRASLVHIVVLSGYNITIVINAATKALQWFPRSARFGASAFVVGFFILMTGGAATAVRAGIMAYLAVYARLTGRTFIALRALGAAAFLMVLWNPFTLAFDPSFQLSSLATLGLIVFTPLFEQRLKWITERFQLREIVSSTLATQLAVLPLLLYQSGNLSLVALPANLLALAVIPGAMAFSAAAAVAGLVSAPLGTIVGLPAYVVLAYIIGVAEFFASLPFAAFIVPAFPAIILFAAYGILFGGLLFYKRKTAATAAVFQESR